MRTLPRRFVAVTAASMLVLALTGCQEGGGANHKAAVANANNNWHAMRSNLMIQMAQRQFDAGDLDQAERSINDAIGIDDKNSKLYTLSGRIALERSQLERAFHSFNKAIEYDPKAADANYYKGIVLQRWERFEDALECFQAAYTLKADNPAYLLAACEMMVALKRDQEALKILEDKKTYFDQNAGVREAIGQIQTMAGQHKEAADAFKEASLLAPEDTHIAEEWSGALLKSGQPEAAVPVLEKLVGAKGMEDRKDLKLQLAAAYQASGRTADAKAIYVKVTRKDPQDAEAWSKLGELAFSQGDNSGAILAANRVIALTPKRSDGYLLAGMALQRKQQYDEAVRHFDKAAELAPDNAAPLILRGLTLEQAGKPEAAAQAYAEALRRQPDDRRARELLARLNAGAGAKP